MSIKQAIGAYQRGDYSTTERLCEKILSQQPGNSVAWEIRGLAAWQTGNHDAAKDYLETAAKINPANSSHHFNRGRYLASTNNLEAAASCFQRVLELSPDDGEALTLLGNIQLQLGNITGAVELQRRAVSLQPGNALFQNNLGLSLVRKKNLADALAAFKRAQQLAPDLVQIARNIGMYSEMSGDIASAQLAIDTGLKSWPDDETLNLVKVKLLIRAGDTEKALAITGKFQKPGNDQMLASDFAFEHAHALELSTEYSAAFREYESANQLVVERIAQSGFSPSSLMNEELVDSLLGYYSHGEASSIPVQIDDGFEDPVFIVGMPRSGTTLLDTVLGSGLNADVLEEEATVYRMLLELSNAGVPYPDGLVSLDEKLVHLLRRAYFDAVNDVITRSATSILVDKMPFNLLHVGLLLRVFPRARIIRALRHPANVALSNFKQNYEDPHSALLFSKLPQIIDLSDKFDQLWVAQINDNASRTMTVKFEDLVTETARTTAGVFKFLGESDALLDDNARREHAREKLNRVTPNYSSITAPLDNRNSSQWRNYSTQLAPYLDRLFKLAAAQGYSDDST